MKKRQNTLIFTFLIIVLSIFVSCGDNSLFDQSEEENYSIELNLKNGSIIESGQSITFQLILPEDEEEPESLEIIVLSANNTKIAESTIKNPESGKDLVLELPDFEPGLYTITFTLYGKEYILTERTVTFFYSESNYLIKGIESFPPVIYPGAEAVLKADLSLPENTDPFLSWTQNNSLIKSGMYSEGLAEINWTAPMAEGVYSIALDVFPIAPVNGSYSFQSQTRMSTEVYVTSTSDISSENDLGPDESYYVLFHFNGNLENSGTGFESLKAEADKELKIIQVNETLGYEMDGISAITIPEFILPLKQNKLQPFTIELGVTFEDIEVNGKILSVKTENNDFYLEIFINNNSVPEVQITSDSTSSSIPSGIEEIAINERYMLNLSVIPAGIGLDVIWFLDGQTYSSGHINNSPSFISDTGSAEIKFKGIIDEFGVYFNSNTSSADPYIFYNAMKLIYKSNVLFADGFDSNELQNQFELTGSASFEAGVLKLKSGQNLTLPEVFIPRPGNINSINILLDSPAGFTYRYNNSLLEIIVSDNELIDKISSVDFTINDNAITISNEAFSVTDEESIIIKIINSTESSIFIDSLLAYTE